MCATNSETPQPIPITKCLGGCGNEAQPQNGICLDCQKRKGTWPLSLALVLIVAVAGLLTGCAHVVYLDTPPDSYSVVTFRWPRRNHWDPAVQWERQEERFTLGAAEDFMRSFTEDEIRVLEVKRTDVLITQQAVPR